MFGLVGESGSGKSTTGRCILRLVEPTSGEVYFRDENVLTFSTTRLRQARRDMQIVFQDPYSSLNPRMRAGAIVEEPLIIHRIGSARRTARRGSPSCSSWLDSSRSMRGDTRTNSAAASDSGSGLRERSR